MTPQHDPAIVRPFASADANSCFKIRAEAFITILCDDLGPEAVTAAVNAYMPADLVTMAHDCPTFVSLLNGDIVGFCMLRGQQRAPAEVFLLYVRRTHHRRGLGKQLIRFGENWLRENHPVVLEVFVDTVVPGYNAAFYEKLGYVAVGEHPYQLPGVTLKAVRLRKALKQRPGAHEHGAT